jgi:hypothetical protein
LLIWLAGCGLPAAPTTPVATPPADQPALEYLGMATIPHGLLVDGTPVGGLSALAWDAAAGEWLALSDDGSERAPARFYSLRVSLDADGRLREGGVEVTGVTTLRDVDGRPFARHTVDPEGLALTRDGALLVSSERDAAAGGPPFVAVAGRDGRLLRRFEVPERFRPAPRRGVRHNFGFEALTLTPGGSLLVGTEGPLAQDGREPVLGQGAQVRVLRFDVASGRAVAEHLYPLGPVPAPPRPAGAQTVIGLVELHALSERDLLALERTWVEGRGNFLRLYRTSLDGADDVSALDALPRPGSAEAPRPMTKSLLLDLASLGEELFNVEGVALGAALADGRRLLLLVSDDNFDPAQRTQLFAFAADAARLATAAPPAAPAAAVAEVQGAGHVSPLAGRDVAVEGVVTAVTAPGGGSAPPAAGRGFWIQDPRGDGDPATSDGLFVAAAAEPAPAPGDWVRVTGTVLELGRDGGLTVTALVTDPRLTGRAGDDEAVEVVERGVGLPAPVLLGAAAGRCPPGRRIDDDGLERYEPAADGIDFWESLEGMLLRLAAPTVVGPTSRFGEVVVVAEGCAEAPRSVHGGLLAGPGDFNPERLTAAPRLTGGEAPQLAVGQRFAADLLGVLDYDFADYRLLPAAWPAAEPRPWQPEATALAAGPEHLTLATLNLENLSAVDPPEKVARLAATLVAGLGAPDLVALQEVQDDSGPANDGVVGAAATLERFADAVAAAGAPRYDFRQVDPEDNRDGGRPGGNIRVALLFDPVRVEVVDRGEPAAAAGVAVERIDGRPALVPSPGRLAPGAPAFEQSRKPLAVEVRFGGETLFVIVNHFASKGGDDDLFGAFQPPRRPSDEQRTAQARLVADLAGSLLAADPRALVAVAGDLNDFEFRPTLEPLRRAGLVGMVERLEPEERYTYVYEGNSQVLDHVLVSPALAERFAGADAVHRHADLPDSEKPSDHDPLVVRFRLGGP